MIDDNLYEAYIEESNENIQTLEEGLLSLERDPADRELINVVFRAMHSIKGGADMVGLNQVNLLSHRLENILEDIRQSEAPMPAEVMQLLLSGTDILRQMLNKGDKTNESLNARLEEVLRQINEYEDVTVADEETVESIGLKDFVKQFEVRMLEEMVIKGKTLYMINVALSPTCFMKSVRAYMVLQAVAERADIIKVIPSTEDLEKENFALEISLLVAGEPDIDELFDAVKAVTEVAEARGNPIGIDDSLRLIYGDSSEKREPLPPQEQKIGFPEDESAAAGQLPPAEVSSVGGYRFYRIEFKFRPDIPESGIDPFMFFLELEENGRFLENHINMSRLPRLEELDTGKLYISWTIFYESKLDKEKVDNIFIIVHGTDQVSIEEITGEYEQWFSGDKKTGELLVERGLVSQQDIEYVLDKQKRIGELLVAEGIISGKQVESVLQSQQQFREKEQADTIRVKTVKLEEILNSMAELVIAHSRAKEIAGEKGRKEFASSGLFNAFQDVDKIIRRLQEEVMNASMIPIGGTFTRYQRMVRDLARDLSKEIELNIEGQETELDKKIIEQISDPLKHLIRNCADHGLETADEREQAGKPARGTINLNAYHQEGSIVIEIADDGRGIDDEKVLQKAREKGLVDENTNYSKEDIQRFIFLPGFSTAGQVTDVSGRGVGLDVVMSNIRNMRGSIDLFSEKGRGTRILIKLPLTLAIIDGMVIRVGVDRYIIPLNSIIEFIKAEAEDIRRVEGKGTILHLRQDYIPYVGLFELIEASSDYTKPTDGILTILKDGKKKLALLVDEIIGQEQVVIKSMKENMEQVKGVAGATIMGDGHVVLILDVASLFKLAQERIIY